MYSCDATFEVKEDKPGYQKESVNKKKGEKAKKSSKLSWNVLEGIRTFQGTCKRVSNGILRKRVIAELPMPSLLIELIFRGKPFHDHKLKPAVSVSK